VLGYDSKQLEFLERLLGKVNALRLGLLFLVAAGLSLFPYLVIRLIDRRRNRPDPRDAAIMRFCEKMARAGFPRRIGEGILDFAERVAAERPQLATEVMEIADLYVAQRYDNQAPQQIAELLNLVRRLNPQKKGVRFAEPDPSS
jgi:hypothetical protein